MGPLTILRKHDEVKGSVASVKASLDDLSEMTHDILNTLQYENTRADLVTIERDMLRDVLQRVRAFAVEHDLCSAPEWPTLEECIRIALREEK
jgi:cell wall assembly regulator SMI1